MELIVYAAQAPREGERALAWGLLRLALARELGLHALPETAREPGGKPYFPARPELQFSLSHSHGGAVCALHSLPVGVDIEKLRPAPRRLAQGMEDEAFFRLWTAKEATTKREGKGLSVLRRLEPDGLCRCLEDLLPGFLVTVCPSAEASVRAVRVDAAEAMRPPPEPPPPCRCLRPPR